MKSKEEILQLQSSVNIDNLIQYYGNNAQITMNIHRFFEAMEEYAEQKMENAEIVGKLQAIKEKYSEVNPFALQADIEKDVPIFDKEKEVIIELLNLLNE